MEKSELVGLLERIPKSEIAKRFNIPIYTLNGITRRYNLTPKKQYDELNLKEKITELLGKHTIKEVAQMLKVNVRTVSYYKERLGIDIGKNYRVKIVGDYIFVFYENELIGRVRKEMVEFGEEKT